MSLGAKARFYAEPIHDLKVVAILKKNYITI